MKKKGFQLSANFVVILILAIVMFGLGIAFLGKMFPKVDEFKGYLDQQTEAQIEALLSDGQRVAIPTTTKKIKSGETAVFGVGILNVDPENNHSNFYIDIEVGAGFDKDGNLISPNRIEPSHILFRNRFEIFNNKGEKTTVAIAVPKETLDGTYVFNVNVCRDGEELFACTDNKLYTGKKKIYLEVF